MRLAIWMYPLTQKKDSAGTFELINGRVDAISDNFVESVLNKKLKKDPFWEISTLYAKIKINDEMYIYGGKGYGLVGRAIVIRKNEYKKQVQLKFNLQECQNIIASQIYIEFFENLIIKRPGRLRAVVELDKPVKDIVQNFILDTLTINFIEMPDMKNVIPVLTKNSLFMSRANEGLVLNTEHAYSKNAKRIGDRAEMSVMKYLSVNLLPKEKKTLRWLAKEGKTPGYDIMYSDIYGKPIYIEVKGTISKIFDNFNITINEWNAAQRHLDNYYLYLVSECIGIEPQIQILQNPFTMSHDGKLHIEPVVFKVSAFEK